MPAVSRQVSGLERCLGTRLVQRSTRHLALTEDGHELAVRARRVLEEVEEAETAIGKRRRSPSGLVHLAAPASFGGAISHRECRACWSGIPSCVSS